MKTGALQRLRERLARDETVYGLWVTLESATITELAVMLGLDWVVIDAEHGHLDWKDINEHIRAALRSDTVVLVRIAERSTALSKRALDIGADGIVVPWVQSAAQLEEAVRDCRYPPQGLRGIGGERATVWGQCLAEHTAEANEHVLVVPLIESVATMPHIASMCQVDGVDVLFFGPADFSSTAGFRGSWEGPGVAEQILSAKDTIRSAGKNCGVMATSVPDLLQRQTHGFRMLGVGADSGLLLRSLHQALRAVDRDRVPATSLDPCDGRAVRNPVKTLPDAMRPDRPEVVTPLGEGRLIDLQEGVRFESLVGDWNSARNLTTGIVLFQPSSRLDCHTHPCTESITVLEGSAEVLVEGRAYCLGPLDNIVIPRWLPHSARNRSSEKVARLHVALASDNPPRDLITREFRRQEMPDDATGLDGRERLTRTNTADRYAHVGPGTEFVDYFNESLIPGIEMSGGYGRFQPGGRLPAHVHDFDESICIIDGVANCRVEGREYTVAQGGTAMVPRGRVHYFINESTTTMDMIWVYAGPRPERIIVEQ